MSILVTQLGKLAADIVIKVTITVVTAYLTDKVMTTTSKKRQTRRR